MKDKPEVEALHRWGIGGARPDEAEVETVARAIAGPKLRKAADNAERSAILGDAYNDAKTAIAAYLSRCPSPERDTETLSALNRDLHGRLQAARAEIERLSSPERDTERLVDLLTEATRQDFGTPGWRVRARAALAEFDVPKEECPICGKDLDHEGYCEP